MWNNTRRGHNLIRKRNFDRQTKLRIYKVLGIVFASCIFIIMTFSVYKIIDVNLKMKNFGHTVEDNGYTDVYNEVGTISKDVKNADSEDDTADDEFTIIALGDIMMGGRVTTNLNYNYMMAFKNISEYTKSADYTIANFTTNITNLDKIENPKSKYIVTKSVLNALNALGVDGVNIANDHILDFGSIMFNTTKDLLDDDHDIIGLKNNIVYAEHSGIKVAIIGVNNEIIGNSNKYDNAGIFIYNLKKIKEQIEIAKQTANTVMIMEHLGSETKHTATTTMKWLYKELIDAGADAVLGSHSLGVYPVEIYNGKPIIYSLGYFISDTNIETGKKSAIFKFTIDIEGKIKSMELTPIYIKDKKEVVLYSQYNEKESTKFLNYLKGNTSKEIIKVHDGTIKYSFK